MTQQGSSLDTAKQRTKQTVETAINNQWIDRLTRIGFVSKGVVYFTIGVLAAQFAFGFGGVKTDPPGAMQELAEFRYGEFLVGVLAAGLLGYSLLRFIQAFKDTEGKGSDAKGLVQRGGYLASGAAYIFVALVAARRLFGTTFDTSETINEVTSRILLNPFGEWLVGLGGVAMVGIGMYQFYRAISADFRPKLRLREMNRVEDRLATWIGRFGFAARGIVFGLVGVFLIQAALQADAAQAEGLEGVFTALFEQPYGAWYLGIVAIGFMAHGISMWMNAWYRRSVVTY